VIKDFRSQEIYKNITNSAYKTNPEKDKQRKNHFLPVEEWWPPRLPSRYFDDKIFVCCPIGVILNPN
jgi:hypothetical protein